MSSYLTKVNPNKWRLQDYLTSLGTDIPECWSDVCRDAKPGDALFIGLSGKEAGIYAKATITSRPYYDYFYEEFYVNLEDAKQKRLGASIDSFQNKIDCPVFERDLLGIAELRRVARWLHVQGGCCHLTEEEAEALNRLIEASK